MWLETISYGHGITTTPLQATAVYSSIVNGGKMIKPSLIKNEKTKLKIGYFQKKLAEK